MGDLVGPFLVLLGIGMGYLAYRGFARAASQRQGWVAVLGSDPTPLAELAAMADEVRRSLGSSEPFGREVTVTGTARPRADVQLIAPLSGVDCVWYTQQREAKVIHLADGTTRIDNGDVVSLVNGNRFRLTDGSASAIVHCRGADVREVPTSQRRHPPDAELLADPAIVGVDEFETESCIPIGMTVTVFGVVTATADGLEIAAPRDAGW